MWPAMGSRSLVLFCSAGSSLVLPTAGGQISVLVPLLLTQCVTEERTWVSQPIVATLLWQPPKGSLGHVVQALHLPIPLSVSLISAGFDVSSGWRPAVEENSTLVWHAVRSGRHSSSKCFSRNFKGLPLVWKL